MSEEKIDPRQYAGAVRWSKVAQECRRENADLHRELATVTARELMLRDSLTRLERGFIALDDETDWLQCRWCEGENTGADPSHTKDCVFAPLATKGKNDETAT